MIPVFLEITGLLSCQEPMEIDLLVSTWQTRTRPTNSRGWNTS